MEAHGGQAESIGDSARIGVLTVSDRASAGIYEDASGPAIIDFLGEAVASPWTAVCEMVPDEQDEIEAALIRLVEEDGCALIITTGGTGPAPRDVTPEATAAVCAKMLPGFGEQMRAISLRYVPTAVLSRQTAGIRGSALILNLPGAPKAIRETLDEIFPAVPYCIDLAGGPYIETTAGTWAAFRPKHARRQPND